MFFVFFLLGEKPLVTYDLPFSKKTFHITFGRFPCLPTRRPPNLLYRPTLLFRDRTCSLAGTYTTVHPFLNFSILFFFLTSSADWRKQQKRNREKMDVCFLSVRLLGQTKIQKTKSIKTKLKQRERESLNKNLKRKIKC